MSISSAKQVKVLRVFVVFGLALGIVWFFTGMWRVNAAADSTASHIPTIDPEPIAHVGGLTRTVFVSGTLAYVGNGSELTIMDVTDPDNPTKVGDIWWKEAVYDIQVAGNYAYVAMSNGLQIVNISNPSSPTVAGSYIIGYSIQSLALNDTQAYLGTNNSGMQIVDVTDPTAPTFLGEYGSPNKVQDVAVVGSYVYAAFTQTIHVVDVSIPTIPAQAGSYSDYSGRMTVADDFLYLAAGGFGMRILDVSQPELPTEVSAFIPTGQNWYYPSVSDIAVKENRAYIMYVGYSPQPYISDVRALVIVDITNPTMPIEVEERYQGLPGLSYSTPIQTLGNYAYIAGQYNGFVIVDIATPTPPYLRYETGLPPVQIIAKDQYVYGLGLGDAQTFYVVDVSNLTNPQVTGSLNGTMDGLWLHNSYVYTIVRSREYAAVRIIDVSTPSNPVIVGLYSYPPMSFTSLMTTLAFKGNYMYVSNYANQTVDVVDISTPNQPTRVGEYPYPGIAQQMAVVGDYLYVDNLVLNISNPILPTLASTYPNDFDWNTLLVQNNRAYVSSCSSASNAWHILDVTNPASPIVLSSWSTTSCSQLELFGNDLIVSAQTVSLLDATDANNPIHVATLFPYPAQPSYDGVAITLSNANGLYTLDALTFYPERTYLPSIQRSIP